MSIFCLNLYLLFICSILGCTERVIPHKVEVEKGLQSELKSNYDLGRKKAKEAFAYCKTKKFNTNFCVLIDMSMHSGLKRFFVWDFKKDTVLYSFLVGHGCCDNPWNNDYSNMLGVSVSPSVSVNKISRINLRLYISRINRFPLVFIKTNLPFFI